MVKLNPVGNEVANKICEALGLKHVCTLDIHIAVDSAITVKAEFYPEVNGVMQTSLILKEYEVELKELKLKEKRK